jgi:hypothetical protein
MAESELVNTTTGELIRPGELTAGAVASEFAEIQGAMFLARKFPRNIDNVFQRAVKECLRPSLAEIAQYEYSRGGTRIKGGSIYLARVLGRLFGNVRWGVSVVFEDNEYLHIQAWAWDIEENVKITEDDRIRKLIWRKKENAWIAPDERDLRELKNRRGAIAVRNCIFSILPRDLVEDCKKMCDETMAQGIKDPDRERKVLITRFGQMNVSVEMLERYLGIQSKDWMPGEMVSLRQVLNAIKDGASTVESYFRDIQQPADTDKTEESAGNKGDKLLKKMKQTEKPAEKTTPAAEEKKPETTEEIPGPEESVEERLDQDQPTKESSKPDKIEATETETEATEDMLTVLKDGLKERKFGPGDKKIKETIEKYLAGDKPLMADGIKYMHWLDALPKK